MFKILRAFCLLRQLQDSIDVVSSASKAIIKLCIFIGFSLMIVVIFQLQPLTGKLIIDGEVPRANNDMFGSSMLVLFQIITGEDWTDLVFTSMGEGEWLGAVILIFWFIFSSFVLLQMFSAVLWEKFALNHKERIELQVVMFALAQQGSPTLSSPSSSL